MAASAQEKDKHMPHAAAWFRREDYQRVRQIMDDSDKFPVDFDAWERRAKGQVEEAKRHGLIITPVLLDPDEFLAFCEEEKMQPNGEARAKFAISRAAGLT